MVKKTFNNDLFVYLDWILKKKGKEPLEHNVPYPYLVNRWLSMADPMIAQIVNATTNKWIVEKGVVSDGLSMGKFFKVMLPKFMNNISYIKKAVKEKDHEDFTNTAYTMQLSIREIESYEKTLAEIKKSIK
jgi:hypothetical protein